MTSQEIESEVRRLSPWYYLYDLHGVRTDITPPCDTWGHRSVYIPREVVPLLQGKTILDAGCNEGQYSFAALKAGAKSVVGFDCHTVNIDKANFVARVLGVPNATFQVGSVDSWPSEGKYDIVFLCGLLYHLPEPWQTIRKFCGIAREGLFVGSMLRGGPDGYTSKYERESIANCEDPALPVHIPNTIRTLELEFTKHGFASVWSQEDKFYDPAAFALFGWRLSHQLNRARVGFLRPLSFLNRFRRYRRTYGAVPWQTNSYATGFGSFFFHNRTFGKSD